MGCRKEIPAIAEVHIPGGGWVRCVCAWGFWARLRGLLGTRAGHREPNPTILLLPRCKSIHTIGMAYPIDVAFADKRMKIIASRRAVAPGTVFSCKGGAYALEREASDASWFDVGEVVAIGNKGEVE